MDTTATLMVRGARGSMPVSGPSTDRYGGRTTCFSVDLGTGEPVIFDCGTGLPLAADLQPAAPARFHIFLTHYHLDHLQGLHLHRPLFRSDSIFEFHGPAPEVGTMEDAVAAAFADTLFPVSLADTAGGKRYLAVGDDPVHVGSLTVTPFPVRHPQGATGYRLDHRGRSIVIATDHEGGDPEIDARIARIASGADTLIHDAQYTPEEYADHTGWGHSTWRHAVDAATAAGVSRLVLTSHDPFRSDDELDAIVERASSHFPDVVAAHEGMIIPL